MGNQQQVFRSKTKEQLATLIGNIFATCSLLIANHRSLNSGKINPIELDQ